MLKLEKDLLEVKKKWFHRKEQKEVEGKIEAKKVQLEKAKATLDLLRRSMDIKCFGSHKGNEGCKSGIKESSAGAESVGFTGAEAGETVSDDSCECAECEGTGSTEKHGAETKYS